MSLSIAGRLVKAAAELLTSLGGALQTAGNRGHLWHWMRRLEGTVWARPCLLSPLLSIEQAVAVKDPGMACEQVRRSRLVSWPVNER